MPPRVAVLDDEPDAPKRCVRIWLSLLCAYVMGVLLVLLIAHAMLAGESPLPSPPPPPPPSPPRQLSLRSVVRASIGRLPQAATKPPPPLLPPPWRRSPSLAQTLAAAAAQSEAQEPREAFFDWRKGQKAHGSGKIVVSRGDTLDDLVARMRQRLDMAVCITVEPEHGLGDGLGNLFASRNLIIDYAARHRPVLRYQFSRMAVPNAHDERGYSQFDDHLFYSSGEGVGCKRNGEDGPKNGQRNCLVGHGSGPGSATIKTFGSTRRILQDGDTLTFCLDHSLRDPTRMAQAAIDKPRLLYDYSATRNALLQAYWADHPQRDLRTPYLKMRRRGELAVVVHFRNGDTSGAKPGASGHRAERYSRDDRGYQEPMAPVVKLPTDCARVFLLTERAADKHVLRFVSWFEEQSRGPP